MGLEALAILALIGLWLRERDLRTDAETRISELEAYRARPGYPGQDPGYGGPGYGPGGQGSGPDRPRR